MNRADLMDTINKLKAQGLGAEAALCAPDVMEKIKEMFTEVAPKTPIGVITAFSGISIFTHEKVPSGAMYFGTRKQIIKLLGILDPLSVKTFPGV